MPFIETQKIVSNNVFENGIKDIKEQYHGLDSLTEGDVVSIAKYFYELGKNDK